MLTPEEQELLQQHVTLDGDGNVVGNDNTVQVTKVDAETYIAEFQDQWVTFTLQDLRQVFHVTNSQVGVIGDNATIHGGIHFNTYQHVRPEPVDDAALAAARERLARLPLEEVPAPAALPPGSRLPFARNPHFVGREPDLRCLAQTLKGGQTAVVGQIAAATGLGGIGKSQLAVEFAHRYGQFFAGGVFWLSFADPQAVPAEIAACGGAAGLDLRADFTALPLEEQVRRVLSTWSGPLPRLLIFDNCEDEALLARWRPPGGGARVLVTSRRGEWDPELGVACLPLDVLSRAESVALLRGLRPDLSTAEAGAIAAELGDLPLALHVAGRFLATYRHAPFGAPAAYLAHLQEAGLAHPSLVEEGATFTTAHARHVGRTFALSYERLDPAEPVDALARDLLARAAHFAPGEPIPRPLLLATVDLPEGDFAAQRQAADALARLVALGLLETEDGGDLLLHRLLAAFVQATVDDPKAQAAVEEAVMREAYRLNEAGYPGPLLAWQSHLRHVTAAALLRKDERATTLSTNLGYHLQMLGDYAGARPYSEQALAIHEATLGPDHSHTAGSLNNLGMLLQAMGDLTGARSYLERALAIREQALGPDHPLTAQSLNNLGALLKVMGDYAGARPYYERALAICEQVLGPDHPDTAQSLNNLGLLLQDMGDYVRARSYYERALAIREATLGFNHPTTAGSLNNLGLLLQAMGDLKGARPYYERALAIREQVLGPDHPHTAQSLNNLGGLLDTMGDYAGARSYYERALAVREATLGSDHPDTATSLNNLGALCYHEGHLEEAARLLRRALIIFETVLGPEHPHTQNSQRWLSIIEAAIERRAGE
jgi:tetratricopeptide (TPR) repeat protein